MQARCILPCSVTQIALFVVNLHHQGMAPKTISTYLSAVSYVHKIRGLNDPTQAFLVRKLTTGAYRLRPSYDLRLPITIPILNRLILSLQYTTTCRYDYVLFRAMYLFAFETFARIGEITSNHPKAPSVVQFSDVSMFAEQGRQQVEVTFRQFKHNLMKRPHRIIFGRESACYSAVAAISEYLQLRDPTEGPFFCSVVGKPIPRSVFDQQLHRSLNFCQLDNARYKGHSFCIGAASHKAELGCSDVLIRSLGRWNSNAYKKYLRMHSA